MYLIIAHESGTTTYVIQQRSVILTRGGAFLFVFLMELYELTGIVS